MSKPKHRVYCPISLRPKMLFETEQKALRFIQYNAENYGERKPTPIRAYFCHGCGGWHLTKREKWDD